MSTPQPARTTRSATANSVRRGAGVLVVCALLAALAAAGAWAATGGRWYVVRTPSMGTAAPVGTLLWVHPTPVRDVHVGNIVTFVAPGLHETYTHRVISIEPGGGIHTKGDANGSPDAWTLTRHDLIGTVAASWPGVGWLVRGLPILVGGGLLLWLLLARFPERRWRLPGAVVGSAFLLSVAVYVLRPLVGADQIAMLPDGRGMRATYISTGLLPLRLHAFGGGSVRMRAGQLGTVASRHVGPGGRFGVTLAPDVAWWWWAVLVAACFVPAVWTTLAAHRSGARPRHRAILGT